MTYQDKIMDGTATLQEFEAECQRWENSAILQSKPCSTYLGVSREVFFLLVTTTDADQFADMLSTIRETYLAHPQGETS